MIFELVWLLSLFQATSTLQLLLSSVSHWQFIIIKEWFFTAICLKGYCQTSVLFPTINLLSLGPTRQGCFMPFSKDWTYQENSGSGCLCSAFLQAFCKQKRHTLPAHCGLLMSALMSPLKAILKASSDIILWSKLNSWKSIWFKYSKANNWSHMK